jgi:hypothetical protein
MERRSDLRELLLEGFTSRLGMEDPVRGKGAFQEAASWPAAGLGALQLL